MKDKNQFQDSDWKQESAGKPKRSVNKDGSFNIKRQGFGYSFKNTYLDLLKMSWSSFLMLILLFLMSTNLLFATIYMLIGTDQLSGVVGDSNLDAFIQSFFFSFQTFTTVGYGSLAPSGNLTSLIASFEAMIGLMSFSIVTGLLYGRFSRPVAHFQYSKNALIAPYKDGWSLQFRIANQSKSQVIELEAKVMLIYSDPSTESSYQGEYFNLKLESKRLLFFPLNWTLVHAIDKASPLCNLSKEMMSRSNMELMILIKGYDDTFSQEVNSRYSYVFEEIVWGGKFVRPYFTDSEGYTTIDSNLIDQYDEVPFDKFESTA